MQEPLHRIYQIIKLGENLKTELRHSWLSNGRRESVAEHTWRMSLMAVLLQPYLNKKVDMEKLLKMIIIHDLVEAEAKDIPVFEIMGNEEVKQQKQMNELKAITNIKNTLPEEVGGSLYNMWVEFEAKQTYEAKVANALDKLEVQIQHNEADISTWKPIEYELCLQLGDHTDFSAILNQLKNIVEQEAKEKIEQSEKQTVTD
ncbi:HD domain-containing protein [Virgibacillus chiguensis]|uniref:Putative hydrolases of HD superfamily n=1 Tax=Virgibacillus chiguensis TaxID=411959 RepID=A0A1M5MAZ5_9BACI|nr:HD domain-containing protein [Virgibacillus chiguensis]SHG74391.1 putative hydrolases of HD superfamily [Virgibacillus chiguensis]